MGSTNRKREHEKRRAEQARLEARRREERAAQAGGATSAGTSRGPATGSRSSSSPGPDERAPIVHELLDRAVRAQLDDDQHGVDLIIDRLAQLATPSLSLATVAVSDAQVLSTVLCEHLSRRLRACWSFGWQPFDVGKVIARLESGGIADVLFAAIADDARHDQGKPMHPSWRSQLQELEPWWTDRELAQPPWVHRCARTLRVTNREVVERCVALLARLMRFPKLPTLIPPPGPGAAAAASRSGRNVADVDTKMLVRVRGLLAKAESTEFAEEADALTAKAQELMTRHAIDAAMVAATTTSTTTDGPEGRRIHLDSPYTDAKASLVGAVARANRCQAVLARDLGFVTVFGFATDLAVVDMLFTSLLAQATTAMVLAERGMKKTPTSSTRSFRQSFLISYANRIGERLQEAVKASTTAAVSEHGDAFMPVLARREADVEDAVAAAFPRMKTSRPRISNAAGWSAGRVAADQASLNVGAEIKR